MFHQVNRLWKTQNIMVLVILLLAVVACQTTSDSNTLEPATTALEPTATFVPTAEPTAVPPSPPPVSEVLPAARGFHEMAYDSESDQIIMYGGELDKIWSFEVEYKTWAYDLANNLWTEMQADGGPEAIVGHGFAYDSESDRIILCAGVNIQNQSQTATWAYDYNTNTWSEVAAGPMAGQGTRMVYDSESDRMILFGGIHRQAHNETWAYDYNTDTWENMEPADSPSPRLWHNMVYDAESDRVILWEGERARTDHVWIYDYNSNTWTERTPDPNPSMYNFNGFGAMAYDVESDRTISFGGGFLQGSNTTDEIWVYDYNTDTWTQMIPESGPGERTAHELVYHSGLDRVVLFGGRMGTGELYGADVWVYDLNTNTWIEELTGEG